MRLDTRFHPFHSLKVCRFLKQSTSTQRRKAWLAQSTACGFRTIHGRKLAERGRTTNCRAEGNGQPRDVELGDEPETTVLLVACAIGLFTGAGVVVFNDAILWIRHIAFKPIPVETVVWGIWARQLSLPASLLVITLPPTIGGLSVGLLRFLSGGFNDPPPSKDVEVPAQRSAGARSLLASVRELGSRATQRILRDRTEREEDAEQRMRLDSGGAASTSDPGSRDFLARSGESEGGIAPLASNVDERSTPSSAGSPDALQSGSVLRRQVRAGIAPVLRTGAAALTLGSGCSLGPEGPSVEIGRSMAKGLGRLLRSKKRRLLPLLAAGSGAGVAAGFNAPISGVFFAVESVLQSEPRNSETEARNSSGLTIAVVLLASVVAAIVSQAGLGESPTFRVPQYQLQSVWEIPLVMLLGSACGLISVGFSYCSEVSSRTFKRINPTGPRDPLVWILMPALGGLCTGVIALAFPEIVYQGYVNVNALLEVKSDDYAPVLLLQMLGAKVIATAVCRGSGLVGGIYAPSIFMGAALGSAFGGFAQIAFIQSGLPVAAPAAYALVGIAGMLAANCQVPLTAVLLLFELTHDYFIIVPTLAAVGISYWTASLPIAAEISARLQAGANVGAGAVASVDGDDRLPGKEGRLLIRQIRLAAAGFASKPSNPSPRTRKEAVVPETTRAIASVEDAAKQEERGTRLSPALRATTASGKNEARVTVAAANGAKPPSAQAEGAATAAVLGAAKDLTAECAAEASCVMVSMDTPLAEALLLLDQASQGAALILDSREMVIGVLTRERILNALETEAECRVSLSEADEKETANCKVELVVSGAVKDDDSD